MPSILERVKTREAEEPQGFMRDFADEPNWVIANNSPVNFIDPRGEKNYRMTIGYGGAAGYVVVGGGALRVNITASACEHANYTMYMLGIGVGTPHINGTSEPIIFQWTDDSHAWDFEGFGYIGGISAEWGVGVNIGGGIKVPNGPFIPGDYISFQRGGFNVGVSHSATYWQKD